MSIAHDHTRRSLARIAGLVLMIWGAAWAAAWILAAAGFCAFALWRAANGGPGVNGLLGVAVIVGGLFLAAIGAGKAWAGWILVQDDPKI